MNYNKNEMCAKFLIEKGLVSEDLLFEDVFKLVNAIEEEKIYKEELSDSNIDYNDEIVNIEYVNENETIDITVTGDNLFYCNNILTKNSFGTAMTMDWLCGIIQTPEQFDERKYMFKNLKSRFGSNINQIVTTGVDYDKMKLINLSDAEQEIPLHIKDKLKYEQSKIDEKEQYDAFDFS